MRGQCNRASAALPFRALGQVDGGTAMAWAECARGMGDGDRVCTSAAVGQPQRGLQTRLRIASKTTRMSSTARLLMAHCLPRAF